MIYRSFTLYDENGTAKSLNGEPEGSELYFENPTGLGFNLAPTFANIGSGFFKNISSDKIPQQSIVGDMIFANYAAYAAFVRWALKAKKLYFAYKPTPTGDEYRCEVAVDYLTKTEKNAGTNLRCPISFKPLTPWYRATAAAPLVWESSVANVVAIVIDNKGDLDASVTIAISGVTLNNGTIGIWIRNSEASEHGACVISGLNIVASDIIEYSNRVGECYIRKTDQFGTVTDLIDLCDVSENIWQRIHNYNPVGTAGIEIVCPNIVPDNVSGTLYEYYRSV